MKIIDVDNVLQFLNESLLLETPDFDNITHLKRHYNQHVLKPNEKFNPKDPKFPSTMTLDEYRSEARFLADEPAQPIQDMSANVVGWVIYHHGDRTNRVIKIRQDSKFVPGYYDVVIYVDNEKDNQIFTFMCGQPKNMKNWADEYQYDLYSQGGPDTLYEKHDN